MLLHTSTANSVCNVFCVNPSTSAAQVFVEVRLGGSTQSPEQIIVPGAFVPANDRIVEGPIYLANTDTVFVYGSDADLSFHLYGQTL